MEVPNPDCSVHSETVTSFRNDQIKEVLKHKFTNPKNKITDESLQLLGELLKALVIETALRSGKMAIRDGVSVVNLNHVESILMQIMLDFP